MKRAFPAIAFASLAACSTPSSDSMAAFEAALAANPSATAVLEPWCASHHLANPSVVRAERLHDDDRIATAATRALLQVGAVEPLRYRHVSLVCGSVVMSVAHNWYVPARLTPQMNEVLD